MGLEGQGIDRKRTKSKREKRNQKDSTGTILKRVEGNLRSAKERDEKAEPKCVKRRDRER